MTEHSNVIDLIELDCSSPAMEDSIGDEDIVDDLLHDTINGEVKHSISDTNDESNDNNQENHNSNNITNDEENENENDIEMSEDGVDDANDGVMDNAINDAVDDEDDDILISDDDIEDNDDNSQSTVPSIVKGKDNGVIELKDSCEATPIDSENSNSVSVSISSAKRLTNKSEAIENGKEMVVIENNDETSTSNVTSAAKLADVAPDISDDETGFPQYMKKNVIIGNCIAINKKTWNDIEIDGSDSILDCPSQVVPLMIKKPNNFPEKSRDKEDSPQKTESTPNTGVTQNSKNMLTIADFYTSSVGNLLVGLGLSRAKQWYHKDAISKVKKQIRREGEVEDLVDELKSQQELYGVCRAANSSYTFSTDKCAHCDFRTEFKLVLEGHFAYPHLTSRREYKCNYCQFATRDPKQIVLHTHALHEKKCLIEIPPQLYECPVCPYESGVKSKAATHITKCLKFFNPEKLLNLTEEHDYPTITPKPITQDDIKIYEATLQALRFAALNPQTKVPHIPGLPTGLQQQMFLVQQQQLGVRLGPGRPPKQGMPMPHNKGIRPIAPLSSIPYGQKNIAPQLYQMLSTATGHTQLVPIQNKNSNSPQMMGKASQFSAANMVMKNSNSSNKPNILSKSNNSSLAMRPTADNVGKSGTFVICEICDGYIKDLEQLRTHMQWIHKVKIHPKMLASRPPLNCQKCQWRFFTDQGLERHLLGAHGLVTSNMQDMVNQNQDGGRCTICGRVFANKLVAHMNQVHKINLKPAHLSYKCTVCSATFNLYRLFENHVYMVHSGSVKRNPEDASSGAQPPKKKPAIEITTNSNEKKALVNHSVVSGNKVVLASNLPQRASQ